MLYKKKFMLSDEEWTLENINEKVADLSEEVASIPDGLWEDNAYDILSNLWLNRDPDGSRFPKWFLDLRIPYKFKDMFDEIFGDF